MVVRYVRDEKNNPFAVIVATGKNKIGLSLCSPEDKFNKKEGLRLATERAEKFSKEENIYSAFSSAPPKKLAQICPVWRKVVERSQYFPFNADKAL